MSKLANLLNERKDTNSHISDAVSGIAANIVLPEGQEPVENPEQLLNDLLNNLDQHLVLSLKIAKWNRETTVEWDDEELPLSDLVVVRQNLVRRLNLVNKFINQLRSPRSRYRFGADNIDVHHLKISDLNTIKSETETDIRKIDNILQSVNWSTEV